MSLNIKQSSLLKSDQESTKNVAKLAKPNITTSYNSLNITTDLIKKNIKTVLYRLWFSYYWI